MAAAEFASVFQQYLAQIQDAKQQKKHHDQLRNIFVSFLSKAFPALSPEDVVLEEDVVGTKVKGLIDALYKDLVFEFKRDLNVERKKGLKELAFYLGSLKDEHFGILTDGQQFELYALRGGELKKIDDIFLPTALPEVAFSWFDGFLFSEKEVTPTSGDIVRRFGDSSAVFAASLNRLAAMAQVGAKDPAYQVKYSEWDKLLAIVYGHSVARPQLFFRHTYLSTLAKLIAYSALFHQKPQLDHLSDILTGKGFHNVSNLAEEDFFCWLLAPPVLQNAQELLHGLVQHLSAYDMTKIDQDLLKELYENLIDDETKHDLGEVYTPDWLVELTLKEAEFSSGKSILDPACGSGTFLFTAIRQMRNEGSKGAKLVDAVIENVVGMDVHPLAVTIAKVNYVLALTPDIADYGKTVIIPVYMANSLQAMNSNPANAQMVDISAGGKECFNIPTSMTQHPTDLDTVLDEMTKFTTGQSEETALDGFSAFVENQGYSDWDYLWRHNLKTMRKLVKQGRNTIWAYILKNYYRPAYLRQRPFDFVAGNPPWLAYRYITEPQYQEQVKRLCLRYQLIGKKEVKLFTQMELASLFFAFCVDIYLKKHGTIAFVMPRSVLTGAKQHKRFQEMLQGYADTSCQIEKVLDVEGVSPLFKVPACVLIAESQGSFPKVTRKVISGTVPSKNANWLKAQKALTVSSKQLASEKLFPKAPTPSPYLKQIKQGATLVPRSFWFVRPVKSPYGQNLAKPLLETDPRAEETAKKPWLNIHLEGEVEADYLYATLLGRQMLPFGYTDLSLVVLPLEEKAAGLSMVTRQMAQAKGKSGLQKWLEKVDELWAARRKEKSPEDVYSRLDYQHLLTCQKPLGLHTVVYNTAGTNLASCVVTTPLSNVAFKANGFAADADVYYLQTKDALESHYLCAFLNSPEVNQAIKPHQTRGQWGPRHIHRRPFEFVPVPRFKAADARHVALANISAACHKKVVAMHLQGNNIGSLRGQVREALKAELDEIDGLVKEILF